jgi:hypothetical protein
MAPNCRQSGEARHRVLPVQQYALPKMVLPHSLRCAYPWFLVHEPEEGPMPGPPARAYRRTVRRAFCFRARSVPAVGLEGRGRWFGDNSQFGRRRRLNAGRRAMLVAIAYWDPAKYDRGNKNSCEAREFDCGGLPRARTIVKPGPNLVEDILAGAHRSAPVLERLAAGNNHCVGNRPARRSM